jgi:hypothetical protein
VSGEFCELAALSTQNRNEIVRDAQMDNLLPLTEYETASDEVKREYDDQIKKHGRITNMKRTLLHNTASFHAYMEWYTLRDLIVPFIGERAFTFFSYAISSSNNCLICSAFFRKILIDAGENPDNPILSDAEKLLIEFGTAIVSDPANIPEAIYGKLKSSYTDEQFVLLISFAGLMYATNLFNTVARVELDEILHNYIEKEG